MSGRAAMIDGILSPLERATVSVLDRGFLYGDSVFETMRTYRGSPFALDRHLARLERSAGLVHIDLPVPLDVLSREIIDAVRATQNVESYVRVMITRGAGELGLAPAPGLRALRIVIVTPLTTPDAELYEKGISAVTYVTERVTDATSAQGAKVGNYLVAVLATRAARDAGAAEALIVDGDARVIEGASSNVFFAKGNKLVTAPLDAGILPGITREIVLDVAKELGLAVELRAARTDELPSFDEAFISSSIRELLPVVRPGPTFEKLLAAFRDKVVAMQLEEANVGPYSVTVPPPVKP
jgi:branched-chain amino acid aminotransferase